MEEMKCPQCGGGKLQALGNGVYKCMYCGHTVVEKKPEPQAQQPVQQPVIQPVYVQPVYQQPAYQQPMQQKIHDRSKTTAIILAFFLGGLGAHKFYLGSPVVGLLYLVFCWTFIPSFISLIDFIVLLCKSDTEFDRQYNY